MHNLFCLLFTFFVSLQNTSALIQDFYWRDYIPGDLPIDALEAAKGRYIGQVYETGFIPGTLTPFTHTATVAFGGAKIHNTNIKILCTNYPERFYWQQVNLTNPLGTQMDNAVKGGYQVNINQQLYIGKAFNEKQWKIGQAICPPNPYNGLWVWNFAGGVNRIMEFELLKYNYTMVAEDGSVLYSN